jgi:general secretion pathway protein F
VSLGNNDGSISLDQLVALNEEMAALVRAGVPLDAGMLDLGEDLPGRLGSLASEIGRRLNQGESLPQILSDEHRTLPTVWRAVVESGLLAGDLPAALESMATTGRIIADMRRAVMMSLIYPLIVLLIAHTSFVFLTTYVSPTMLDSFRDLAGQDQPFLSWLAWLGDNSAWWAVPLPLIGVASLGIWWFKSSRAQTISSSTLMRWPASLSLLRNCRLATFAEVLSLLVRQNVPLHKGLELASAASGDAGLREAGASVAASLRRGEPLTANDAGLSAFPPLLGWLIAHGARTESLGNMLREMAERYRNKAKHAANWSAVYLPIIITVVVGGTVTLLQAFAVFVPLTQLFIGIARQF